LLELDRIVVSKFLSGLDDEQVFDVSQLALHAGNNIGTATGMVVRDDSQNQGLGTALMEAILDFAC